jgi:hypothetical protein
MLPAAMALCEMQQADEPEDRCTYPVLDLSQVSFSRMSDMKGTQES